MAIRHNKTIIQMVRDGWNFNEIQNLFRESKAKEREFVREIQYFESHRIIDFSNIKEYYCKKCKVYHRKYGYTYQNGKSVKHFTKSFEKCKQHALNLSKSEVFNLKFKKSWNKYNKNEHKKRNGSKLQ